jgi:hypothetical protein
MGKNASSRASFHRNEIVGIVKAAQAGNDAESAYEEMPLLFRNRVSIQQFKAK